MELDPLNEEFKYVEAKIEGKSVPNQFKKVVCPNCGNSVNSNDINIQEKIAKCGSCHGVFSFQNALESLLENSKVNEKIKPKLEKQMDIDILEYNGELSVSIINFTDWTALIAFTISFVALLGSLIAFFENGSSVLSIVISSVMLLAFSIYRFISWEKNKSYIDVDEQYLYVKNRPKNFQKDKTYSVSRIRQFYTKLMPGSDPNSGYFHLYMIYDGLQGEEHVKVSPYLRSRSRALYLEQELEKYLNIPDEIVSTEFRPPVT